MFEYLGDIRYFSIYFVKFLNEIDRFSREASLSKLFASISKSNLL